MWMFTRLGFYSVVKKADGFHVRARRKAHLRALLKFVDDHLPQDLKGRMTPIIETRQADYRWRIVVSATRWQIIGTLLVEDVSYDNVKKACERDATYAKAMNEVWATMMRLQT